MSTERKRGLSFLLTVMIVLTLAFIWGNSLLDREASTGLSTGLLELVRPVLEFFGVEAESDHWLRKLAHFCEFGLLGVELVLLTLVRGAEAARAMPMCAAASLLVAVIDESIQHFSGRYPHILDVLLDFSGSLCGIIGVWIIYSLWRKHNNSKADTH